MSWWTDFRDNTYHIGAHVSHGIKHADKWLRKHNFSDFYVGAKTNGQNTKVEVTPYTPSINPTVPDERQINDDMMQAAMTQEPTQSPTYSTPIGNMPAAYKANAAGTAESIKQGGMTKDELIQFNQKHPNETANRG